jgi:hypothetical protein
MPGAEYEPRYSRVSRGVTLLRTRASREQRHPAHFLSSLSLAHIYSCRPVVDRGAHRTRQGTPFVAHR